MKVPSPIGDAVGGGGNSSVPNGRNTGTGVPAKDGTGVRAPSGAGTGTGIPAKDGTGR